MSYLKDGCFFLFLQRINPSAEMVMIDRMFNQEERASLSREKRLALVDPGKWWLSSESYKSSISVGCLKISLAPLRHWLLAYFKKYSEEVWYGSLDWNTHLPNTTFGYLECLKVPLMWFYSALYVHSMLVNLVIISCPKALVQWNT